MKHPNRRKYRDNPYTILSDENQYWVSFIDSKNNLQKIEVYEEVYEAFNTFELEDLSQMNYFDRHIEHLEKTEEELYQQVMNKDQNIEEIVINNFQHQQLQEEIKRLDDIPRRRLKMYYFYNMRLKDIAEQEKCSVQAVKDSIDRALVQLRKALNSNEEKP